MTCRTRWASVLTWLLLASNSHVLAEVYVDGVVVYPNGGPVEGATVTATTDCDSSVRFVVEATTDEHGYFTIIAPDAACRKLRFRAAKKQELWLQSGEWLDILEENGTTPTINLAEGIGEHVEIRLGQQGGEVSVRLTEQSEGRTYAGGMLLQRCDADGEFGGGIMATTEPEDPIWTVLVPAGPYCVGAMEVNTDNDLKYPATPNCLPIQVIAGERQIVSVPFDASQLRDKWSFFELVCPGTSGQEG